MGVFYDNFPKNCRAFGALLLSKTIFTPVIKLLAPFFPPIFSQKIHGFALFPNKILKISISVANMEHIRGSL